MLELGGIGRSFFFWRLLAASSVYNGGSSRKGLTLDSLVASDVCVSST